jgi:hypothetical protein
VSSLDRQPFRDTLAWFRKFAPHEPRWSSSFRLDLSKEIRVVVVNDPVASDAAIV